MQQIGSKGAAVFWQRYTLRPVDGVCDRGAARRPRRGFDQFFICEGINLCST